MIIKVKVNATIHILIDVNFRWNYSQFKQLIYNGEFDPGSGWTLAAGLIHASRGAARVAIPGGDRQTGAEHVRNLPETGE